MTRRQLSGGLAAVLLSALGSCGTMSTPTDHIGQEKLYWQSPILLPDVTPDLRRPGFWVSQLTAPDVLLMTPEAIQAFNRGLEAQDLVRVFPYDRFGPGELSVDQQLSAGFDELAKAPYHLPDGSLAAPGWWQTIRPRLNLENQTSPEARYALTTVFTDQRVLPDGTRLTTDPFDVDFDEFQNSGWDLGTAFAVFKDSRDGQWAWTRGSSSDGWIARKNLAFCTKEALADWESRDFVVVTAVKTDLFGDQAQKTWKGWVRMGTRLPLEADEGDSWRVTVPVTKADGTLGYQSAWVAKADASHGYLPYTPRTIVTQAFKFLDKPYGWGDQYGEQDCSRFVEQVFATVGVVLPRNSRDQGRSGLPQGTFARHDPGAEKLEALEGCQPGATLVRLDGHIMLFLGMYQGKPYAIHSFWGYAQPDGDTEVFRVVNRVSVSTLDLGAGSRRGSFLERILNIADIRNTETP